MSRLGKRVLSGCLAVWLICTVSLDAQARAALAIREYVLMGTTVSQGDNDKDTSTSDGKYEFLEGLKSVDADKDGDIDNWLDIGNDVVTYVNKYIIADTTGKVFVTTGNKMISSGEKMVDTAISLTTKARNMQVEINALNAKLGQPGSKGAKKRLDKLLERQAIKNSSASQLFRNGDLYKISGKALSTCSIFFDVCSIADDYEGLGNLKNEHASIRAIEGGLYVTDMAFSGATIIAATVVLAGGTVSAPVTLVIAAGGIIVGAASAIVGSEGFANMMNNVDNEFLRAFDNMVSSIYCNIKTALGIGCYKPNIYIYGADGRLIRVIFGEPGLVVTSDPYYNPAVGWSVIAEDDGTLINEDGSYDYLFYESAMEKSMFYTTEAFHICSEERADAFRDILKLYGFSEEEVEDFVEFWDEKLEPDKEYLMYPQYTATVDKAMPVNITPEPDRIYRIWFVFEEYNGQEYDMATPVEMERDGYFVVEWGGMVY